MNIFVVLVVFLVACLVAAIYELIAIDFHTWPTITYEVRLGERTFPVVYLAVMFTLGVLAGHFWQ